MNCKHHTTTISDNLWNDFKLACNSNNQNMNVELERFMISYIENFKSSQEKIPVEYNKILEELLKKLVKILSEKSKDEDFELLSIADLFGGLYERSKIQAFDRLSQLKGCKDDISVDIERKKYLLDDYIYYAISKKILDGIIISKDEIIKNISEINI